jgi:dynein heavy chain
MDLKKQVQKAETETIFELEKKLFQARIRLEFLLDNTSLSPAQVRSNNQTFSWNDRMPAVFEEHKQIASEKTTQFQEALKLKRERFIEELENASKQVDEFNQCGEMQDLTKYYKKAQQLEQKLTAANDRIEQFNAEEEAFAWELTQYPMRLQAYNALQPYLKLYEIGVEFTNKHKVSLAFFILHF